MYNRISDLQTLTVLVLTFEPIFYLKFKTLKFMCHGVGYYVKIFFCSSLVHHEP